MSDGGPEPEGPEPEVAGPEGAGPRALPKSGLGLSALGLGTAWIGERGNPGGAAGAAATVNQALVQGLSYVDTAPHYGIGMAERRIGPALAGRPRESFAVSTKVGPGRRRDVPPTPRVSLTPSSRTIRLQSH